MSRAWTHDRESDLSRVFMSVLRMRSGERWEWGDDPLRARVWLIDGNEHANLEELLELHPVAGKPPVAYVAQTLSALPNPSWSFFRAPLQPALLQRWFNSSLERRRNSRDESVATAPQPMSASSGEPWRAGVMQLTRWPNIAAYGTDLEIALTCSQLMQSGHRYPEVHSWGMRADALDRMLADAYAAGILMVEQATPAATVAPARQREDGNWGLIRRVMHRFARR